MSIQSADGAPGTRYATFGTPMGIITTDCRGLSACTRAAAGSWGVGAKPATDAAAARRRAARRLIIVGEARLLPGIARSVAKAYLLQTERQR